jgi:hemerythrin-like domain-containing protein
MKRHESLAPLSRDHHGALILAQLLKRNAPIYKGLPATITDKAEYAVTMYHNDLKKHFDKEELLLGKVSAFDPAIARLMEEIIEEHRILSTLFLSINNTTDQEAILNELGNTLDAHIRKEERVLFPLIQKHCPEELLQELGSLLT